MDLLQKQFIRLSKDKLVAKKPFIVETVARGVELIER